MKKLILLLISIFFWGFCFAVDVSEINFTYNKTLSKLYSSDRINAYFDGDYIYVISTNSSKIVLDKYYLESLANTYTYTPTLGSIYNLDCSFTNLTYYFGGSRNGLGFLCFYTNVLSSTSQEAYLTTFNISGNKTDYGVYGYWSGSSVYRPNTPASCNVPLDDLTNECYNDFWLWKQTGSATDLRYTTADYIGYQFVGNGILDLPVDYEYPDDVQLSDCGGMYHIAIMKNTKVYDLIYDYNRTFKNVKLFSNYLLNASVDSWTISCRDVGDESYISFVSDSDFGSDRVFEFRRFIVNETGYDIYSVRSDIYNQTDIWVNYINKPRFVQEGEDYYLIFIDDLNNLVYLSGKTSYLPPSYPTYDLMFENITKPVNNVIGNNMTTYAYINNTNPDGKYYLFECDYLSPLGYHYYPNSCGYIDAYDVIKINVSMVANELGVWTLNSCSIYVATNSSCSDVSLSEERSDLGNWIISEPPELGVSKSPRRCYDVMNEWFAKRYGVPFGDKLFLDGSNVEGDGYEIGYNSWVNVSQMLTSCNIYGTPILNEIWFKDNAPYKRSFYVFSNSGKAIVVFQDKDDVVVWDNATYSVGVCDGVCYEILSDKGMVYYYNFTDAEGVVIMLYSNIHKNSLGDDLRYGRFYLHEIRHSDNLYWGYEGGSFYPLQDQYSIYMPSEEQLNSRFVIKRGLDEYYYDTFNVSTYGFCFNITNSGYYELDDDIYSAVSIPNCINIQVSDVVLNLRGHKIVQLIGGSAGGVNVEPSSSFVWTDAGCSGCLSNITITDGSIERFSYIALSIGGVKNSVFNNLKIMNNELGLKSIYGDNNTYTNLVVSGNQNGIKLDAHTDTNIRNVFGINVIRDMDVNYLNRSSISNLRFGDVAVSSLESKVSSQSKEAFYCYDCQFNNFCALDLMSSSVDFKLFGNSKNNFFVSPKFRDTDVEIFGNKTPADVGAIINSTGNYFCDVYGKIELYGNNTIDTSCPTFIKSCEERICSPSWFCVSNITKAYVNSECYVSNYTDCDYYCGGGNCISKPISEWGLDLLKLLFPNDASKFFASIILVFALGVGFKVMTGSNFVGLIMSALGIVFVMIISFIPVWIGLIILFFLLVATIYDMKRGGEL